MAVGVDDLLIGSIASSIFGGILGASSQSEANRLNAQIQRETNEQNYKMFHEGMDYNTEMWNKTNEWNTPENQRKLLEDAGYNPALLNPSGSPASNISSPSPSPAQVGNPMQPTFSGNMFSEGIANGASSVAALMSASNMHQEAIGKKINNITLGAKNAAELQGMQQDNAAKAVNLAIQEATKDDIIQQAKKQNALLDAETENYLSQKEVNKAVAALRYSDIQVNEKQIEQIESVVELNKEMKLTEKSKQALNKILGDESKAKAAAAIIEAYAAASNAATAASLGKSQEAVNYSQASLYGEQQFGEGLRNQVFKEFGRTEKGMQVYNLLTQAKLNEAQKDDLYNLIKQRNWSITRDQFELSLKGLHEGSSVMKSLAIMFLFGM